MKVLSLFDGISCGLVALQRAGIKVDRYVAYEIEENAIKVSQFNYPEIEHKGDVFKADYSTDNSFDILIGGSPCTYWSIAGARAGGTRETKASGLGWDLFSQYVRALKETKPRWFLYENNASMAKEIKQCISEVLGCEPIEIDSADFSAQHRKRYYWTNIPVKTGWTKSSVLFSDIKEQDTGIKSFEKYKDTVRISEDGMCISWDTSGKGNYSQQNRARRIKQKWNTLPSSGSDKNNIYISGYLYRKITPLEAERLQTLPDGYTSCLKNNTRRIEVCGNGWTVDVIAYLLGGLKRYIKEVKQN
jgi:site-specific DNA-cytosine methylase